MTGLRSAAGMAHPKKEWIPCEKATLESEAVSKQIRRLYDAGAPLFTKDGLWEVQQQLEKSLPGDEILIRGLNGEIERYDNMAGRTEEHYERCPEGTEWIYQPPHIHYRPFQALVRTDIPIFALGGPYCNLRIAHTLVLRNKITGEINDPFSPPAQPLDKVKEFFQSSRAKWEASEAYRNLKDVLTFERTPSRINKIVAFACGSMTLPRSEDDSRAYRPSFQHALILSLRGILQEKAGTPEKIACYAQDPIYSTTDKSVLEGSGVKVLEDPAGFIEVDESSVVISCSPNVPVKQIVSEVSRPAIMIWDMIESEDVVSEDGKPVMLTDPDSPRVREMIRNFYEEFRFPGDKEHFGSLSIYIRRTETPVVLN